jgi:membrane associated rhomboid family serine protease
LKFIIRAVDRFCAKHPRFGIPNLMLYIIIGNAVVYLFSMMDRTGLFLDYLYFIPSRIVAGEVWRLITFMFIPEGGNILFVALFLYFYYFIGSTLERTWGSGKFTIYYFAGVMLNIIYGFLVWIITGLPSITIGLDAHYINLSMFFAFATIYPETRVLLFFFIPIKIKWLALLNGLYFLYTFVVARFPLNFMPLIAILNYLIFCGEDLARTLQPMKYRMSRQNMSFRSKAKKAEKQSISSAYKRKCAVCGRTDEDYPNLDFRYCSRCEGYHCFCEDHINNHEHFKE